MSFFGRALGSAALGYLQGENRGEQEGFRREQIEQTAADRRENQRLLAEHRKAALAARPQHDPEEATRKAYGVIAAGLIKMRYDPSMIGTFADPKNAAETEAVAHGIEHALGVASGKIPLAQADPSILAYHPHAPGVSVPHDVGPNGEVIPARGPGFGLGMGAPRDESQGFGPALLAGAHRFPVDVGGGRQVAPPDIPELPPGTAYDSPGGGTFIPSPGSFQLGGPGAMAPDAPIFEIPRAREQRLAREAKAAAATAKKPLTEAQARLAASRAAKTDVEAGQVPTNAHSKRLLQERQGQKALADAAAIPRRTGAAETTAGAAATRAGTDKRRQADQERHNRAVEADASRKTALAELNGAAGRAKSAADVKRITQQLVKSKGQMTTVDSKQWDYFLKRAMRTKKGDFGKEILIDDAEARRGLEALAKKYHVSVPLGAGLGTGTGAATPRIDHSVRPDDIDFEDWQDVGGLIEKGHFDQFMQAVPANHPRRVEAKRIYRLRTGKEWKAR